MASRNKTPLIGWHSEDPTLKPWITSEAKRRGQTVREFLDHVLSRFRGETPPPREAAAKEEGT